MCNQQEFLSTQKTVKGGSNMSWERVLHMVPKADRGKGDWLLRRRVKQFWRNDSESSAKKWEHFTSAVEMLDKDDGAVDKENRRAWAVR